MWVANSGSNDVTELSPAGATLGTFAVGDGAGGGSRSTARTCGSPTRRHQRPHVTKLSPAGATLGTFPVGTSAYGIAFDGTNMWASAGRSLPFATDAVTKLSLAGATVATYSTRHVCVFDGVGRQAHVARGNAIPAYVTG